MLLPGSAHPDRCNDCSNTREFHGQLLQERRLMRRFGLIVAVVTGAMFLALVGYYGTVAYDYSQESKRKFENGTLFKRY